MSLGFQRAGFEILGGVEFDPHAAMTYTKNLFKGASPEEMEKHLKARDINAYMPRDFARDFLNTDQLEDKVDIIIGGPPCQAFARIGRAKLRQIMDHQEAYLNDHRADLYTHFLMYVETFQPKAVVMENVPEILSFGGKNVGEEIAVSLKDLGYRAGYTLLNAAHFGVPQTRVRFFLIAYREDLVAEQGFPEPTHYAETANNMYLYPANGASEKAKTFGSNFLHLAESTQFQCYAGLIEPNRNLPVAVTTKQAIGDLPHIYTSEVNEKKVRRDFETIRHYRPGRPSNYAKIMRNWPKYEASKGVTDQVIRYLPRDHEIFRRMKHGDQYPQASEIAKDIFLKELQKREKACGHEIDGNSFEYEELLRRHVPPYPTDKFPNKWQKLDPQKPSHTITAHLGKDTYSHIHYDSEQARVISIREAARLQSFPDGFVLPNALSHSLRQIGNAVPPWLAFQIARTMKTAIK
jgi:DNA (cytosine-5)-methyltransferase 1